MITEHPMFNKIKDEILDILFPKKCLGCGREGAYICKDCEVFLSEVNPVYLPKVSHLREVQNVMSVWEYEGLMERLIQKIKYDGCYDIVGELVEKAFEKIDLELLKDTIITFVPMWRKKEKRRGFNQAELIAQKVGEKTGRPVVKLLEKVKDNRSQVGLNPQERAENVKDAFRLALNVKQSCLTFNVVVVDDVYTTGATMGECIKILKKAGVKQVFGFTIARKMSI